MRKRFLKLINSLIILLLLINLNNCSDNEIIETQKQDSNSSINLEVLSWEHFSYQKNNLAKKIKNFKTKNFNRNNTLNSQSNFHIKQNRVQLMQTEHYNSYTFIVTRDTPQDNVVENFVYKEYLDGTFEQYLLKYNYSFDENYNKVYNINNLDVTLIDAQQSLIGRSSCYPEFVQVLDDVVCTNNQRCTGNGNHLNADDCDCHELPYCDPPNSTTCELKYVWVYRGCNQGGGFSDDNDDNYNGTNTNTSGGGGGNNNCRNCNDYNTNLSVPFEPPLPITVQLEQKLGIGITIGGVDFDEEAVSSWINNPDNIYEVFRLNAYLSNKSDTELNEARDFALNYIETTIFSQSNDTLPAIQRLITFMRQYGEAEHEIVADYYDSILEEYNDMIDEEKQFIHGQVVEIKNDILWAYVNAVFGTIVSDLVIPVVSYALFEAGGSFAIKLIQKIPLPSVLVGTRLNNLILKTTQLGNPGVLNSRLIPNSTASKAEALFMSLTKNSISTVPAANNPAIKVAHMGNGTKIILRPNSTTVPEAVGVIEYQNFTSLLGTNSYTLKFIP